MKYKCWAASKLTEKPCAEAVCEGEFWIINIETLADLMAFCERNGPVIIEADPPAIMIYDDYLE